MLDPVFRPNVNFRSLMYDLANRKLAFVPQALQYGFCNLLEGELRRGEFETVTSRNPVVQENYERYRLLGPDGYGKLLKQLVDVLCWGIRLECGKKAALADWYPNDIEVHRYQPGEASITSHKDFSCNLHLVAVVTVAGYASFYHHGDTRESPARRYETGPGSLVLLDISQYHAADAPISDDRLAVVMWMNQSLTGEKV